jgi:hypothetical protein
MLNYQNRTPLAIMSLDAVQWQIFIAAAGDSVSVFTRGSRRPNYDAQTRKHCLDAVGGVVIRYHGTGSGGQLHGAGPSCC